MAGPDGDATTDPGHQPDDPVDGVLRFLRRCHRRLAMVAADDRAIDGTAALAAALDRADAGRRDRFEPGWLPVLSSVEALRQPGAGSELAADVVDLAPALPWVPTHRATDGGTELALAPLNQILDLGDTIVGLMYVGPEATYPLHHHPPQELYLTIAGHGRWRYGGNQDFEPVEPDRTLYNHPGDLHSAQAGPLPVVALYILW